MSSIVLAVGGFDPNRSQTDLANPLQLFAVSLARGLQSVIDPRSQPNVNRSNAQTLTPGPQTDMSVATAATTIVATPPLTWNGQPSIIHTIFAAVIGVIEPFLAPIVAAVRIPLFSDGTPPFYTTFGLNVQSSEFEGMQVWTLTPPSPTGRVVVGLHGGGYVTEAIATQWLTYADMARQTGATVIVPTYPLIPEGTAAQVVPVITDLLANTIANGGASNVSVVGDSAGGGLALAAVQQLVRRGEKTPYSVVLESPWLDAAVSDPASDDIRDPLIDVKGLRVAGAQWAGRLGPSDPLASPINGSLQGLPPIYVYTSTLDSLSPQSLRFKQLADDAGASVTLFYRKGLTHDWITFPIFPEAVAEWPAIYQQLGLINGR